MVRAARFGWVGVLCLTAFGCTLESSSDGWATDKMTSAATITCAYVGSFHADFSGLHRTGEEGSEPLVLRHGALQGDRFVWDRRIAEEVDWSTTPSVLVTSNANALEATIIVPSGYEETGEIATAAFPLRCDQSEQDVPAPLRFDEVFAVSPSSTGAGVVASDRSL